MFAVLARWAGENSCSFEEGARLSSFVQKGKPSKKPAELLTAASTAAALRCAAQRALVPTS